MFLITAFISYGQQEFSNFQDASIVIGQPSFTSNFNNTSDTILDWPACCAISSKGMLADEFGVATPADWRPGDDVIIGPAGSCGTAKDRMEDTEIDCKIGSSVLSYLTRRKC